MKNKLLIYILLSFFCMVPAKAQVLEYYVQADDHAIVREFDTAEALAYVEDVSGQGYFTARTVHRLYRGPSAAAVET